MGTILQLLEKILGQFWAASTTSLDAMVSNGTNGAAGAKKLTGDAWLIGGGIASLAAAVHLIHDAHVAPDRIHILEAGKAPGGTIATETRAGGREGYVVRGARKLNFTYHCFYETLSRIPLDPHGQTNGPRTLLDRIRQSWPAPGKQGRIKPEGRAKARLVASTPIGPEIIDTSTMGLAPRNQADLMALLLRSEESLGDGTIRSFFPDLGFFESNFWDLFSTMYMFKPWHSAVEFRRYLHRFLHEFPNISTLAGIEYMPVNDFEATIVPIVQHLKGKGVEFRYGGSWSAAAGG
jgi:oleate hydratase